MSDQWIVITDPDGQEHRFPAAEYTETQAIQEVRRLRGERVNRSAWGDAGSLLTSGMGALESSIGGALDFVGLDEMGRPFQERGLSTQRRASTRYSPELARDLDRPGIQLGDVFAATVESAPGTAAIMAPGIGLGALGSIRGLQGLSGLARPASALLEGAQSGGGSVQAIEEAIRAYAISEPQAFAASEEGQRALREAGGDFGRAVEIAADRANGVWPALIGSFVGAVGFAGVDPADLFRTAGGQRQIANLLLNIPRRAGQEAAEEFIQSAGEQAGTNLAVGAIDPSRDLLDHVLESALLGAAAGGVGGTIFGGAESGAQGLRNILLRNEVNPQIEGDLEARRDDVNRGYDEAEGVTEEEITEPDLGQDDAVDASVLAGDEPPEDEGGMGLDEALFNFSNLFEGRGAQEEPTDEEVRQATSDLVDAMVAAGLSEQEIFDAIESPDALIDLAESAVSDRGDVDATPEEDGGGDEAATDSGEDDGAQQEVSPRTRYYTDLDRIETAYNDREAAIQTDDFDAYEEAQSTLINAAEEIFGADYAAAYQEAFEADIAETGGENAPAIEAKLATDIENYLKEQGRLGGQEDGTQDAAEIAEDGGATSGEPAVVAGEADDGPLAPSDKGSDAALALPGQPTAEAVEEEMAAVTPPETPKPTLEDIQSLTGIEDPDEFDAAVGERGWTAADLKALRDTLPKPDPNDIGTQAELYRSIGDAISAARKAEKAKGRSVSNKTPRPQTLGETRQTANPPVQQQDSASAPENKMVSGDTASILRALGNRSVTALQNNPNAMANLERAVSDAREQVGENRIGPATRTPKEFKTKAEWLISESKRLLTKAPAVKTPEQFGEDKISNRLADKDLAKPSKTRGEASASEPRATKSKDVLERVAAAIHDEWESHANSVYPDATAARQKSWAKNFGPYDGLTDEIQEYDRVEARPMIEAAGRAKTERDAINAIAAIERERHQRWINTVISKNQVNEDAQAWLQSARAQKQFEERYKDFAKEIVAITGFGFAVEQQAAAPREEGKAVQPPNTSQTEAGSRGEETPEALPVDDEVDTAVEEPAQEPKPQKPLSMAEQLQRRLDEIDPTVPRPSEDYDTPTPSDPSLIDEMAEVATARNGKPYKDPSTRAQRQAERAFELAIGEPDPDGNVDLNDFNVDVFIDALNAIDGVFDRARAAQVAARYVDKETREEMIDRVYGFSAVANYLDESGDTLWGGLYSTKRKIPLKKLPREIRNLRRSQDNSVFRGNWRSPAHSGVKSVAERTRIYEFLKTTLIPALNRRRVKVPANPSLAEFAKVEGAYQDLLAAITAHINNDLTYEMRAELLHRRTGWLNEQVEMGRLETRTVDDIFHGATSGLYIGGDWRQYAGRSNGPTPQYTYEWQERKQALAVRLNQYLRQMGFSDVAGRIVDVVRNPDNMNPEDASASYLAKLLIISMGGDDYTGDRSLNEMSLDEAFEQVKFRADHELVHAMRQLGLLTDGEWEVLKNFAYSHGLDENGRIVPVEKHKDSFRGQITDDPLYWNVLSKYPPSERNIIADEEAVAIAFQNLKKMPPRRAKGVFAKIGQIIRAIMRALRMAKVLNPDQIYINAQDIAGQMMDGKVGARRRDYMRGAETSASAIVSRSSRLQSFMFRGLFGRRPRIDDPKSYTKITGPEGPRVDAGRFNMALMRHLNALNRPEREILMWAEIAVEIEHEIDALRQEDGFLVDEAKGMHYQQLHLDLSDAQDRRHQIINTIGNEFWDNNFLIGLMSAIIATRKPLSEITPEELSRYLDYGDQSRSGDADGQVFMMAGSRARTANMTNLGRAMHAFAAGKTREEIWPMFGWFKGADGKWRWEIDDSLAKLRMDKKKWHTQTLMGDDGPFVYQQDFEGKLGDVLRHNALFEAYPWMRAIPIEIGLGDYYASTDEYASGETGQGKIKVYAKTADGALNVLLHELQHVVQYIEEFDNGGSPASMAAQQGEFLLALEEAYEEAGPNARPEILAAMDKIKAAQIALQPGWFGADKTSMAGYQAIGGEAEARMVQKRQKLSAKQRRERGPWLDYDVPEDGFLRTVGAVQIMFDPDIERQITDTVNAVNRQFDVTMKMDGIKPLSVLLDVANRGVAEMLPITKSNAEGGRLAEVFQEPRRRLYEIYKRLSEAGIETIDVKYAHLDIDAFIGGQIRSIGEKAQIPTASVADRVKRVNESVVRAITERDEAKKRLDQLAARLRRVTNNGFSTPDEMISDANKAIAENGVKSTDKAYKDVMNEFHRDRNHNAFSMEPVAAAMRLGLVDWDIPNDWETIHEIGVVFDQIKSAEWTLKKLNEELPYAASEDPWALFSTNPMARSGYGRKSFNVNFVRRKMETGLGGKPKAILTELNKERARRGLAPASINTVQSIMQRLRKEGVVDITDPNYQSEYIAAAIGRLIAAVDDVVRQNDGKKPRGWVSTVAAQTGYEPASVETMWSNIKAGKYGEAAANDAKGVDGGRAGGRLRNDRDGQLYASRRRNPGALWDPKLFGQLPGYVPLPGRQYEINPLQMYSAAEKAATEFPTDRSNKFTMRKYLQRRVKKAELDYIGINDLLGGSGADKVTKQELVDFIRARKLKMDVRYYYGQHSDPAAKFGLFTHPGRSRWVDDQGGQRWVPDYDDSIIGGHARYTINPNEVIDNNYIEVAARLLEGPGSEFDYAHFGGPGTVWGFLASDYAVDLDGESVNAFMIHQGQSDLHDDNDDSLYEYRQAVSRISNEVAREYRDNVMMPYLVEKRGWREVRSAPDNFDHALWRAPNGQVVWAPETFGGVWSGEDATTILNDPDGWLRSSGSLKEKMSELRAIVANGRQYSRAQYEKDVAEARDEETRKRLQEEYEDSEFFTQQWLDFVLPETEKRINAWLRENEAKPAPFEKSWPEAMFRHALMMAISSGHDALAWASGDTIRQYPGHASYQGTFYDERWPTYARNWLKRFGAEVRKVNLNVPTKVRPSDDSFMADFSIMLHDEAIDLQSDLMALTSGDTAGDTAPRVDDFISDLSDSMFTRLESWTTRISLGLSEDRMRLNEVASARRFASDYWSSLGPVDQTNMTDDGYGLEYLKSVAIQFATAFVSRMYRVYGIMGGGSLDKSIYVMRITPEMRAHFRETGGAQMFATRSRPHTISPGAKARSAVSDEISRRMGIQPPTARGFSNARKPGSTFLGQSPRERARRVMELTQRQGQPRQWSKRVSSSLVTFLADQGRKLERSNPSLTLGHTIGRGLRNFAYGITTLGNLPGQGYYLTLRSLLMGDINAGIDHAERLNKLSERMTEKDYEQFRDYMLTRDAEPSSIENEDVRAAAVLSKELFSKFGEENVRIGRLDERQLKKYQGRYLPRKYFRYIENSLRTTGIRLGKEGYTRERLPGQDRQIFGALDMAGYTETVEAARTRLSGLLKTASEADVTRAGMYLSHRVRSPNAVNDAALRSALPAIRAELDKIQAHVDSLDLITLAPAFPRGHKTPGATIEYGPYQMKKRYGEHYLARAFFRAAKRDNSIGYVLEQSAIDAQITDPIVLTATGLAEQNRDLAVYHFFMALQYFQEEHAKQNPDAPDVKWIYPDQMVVWRGRQMTVDALQAMLESAQKNFHLNQNPIMRAYAEKEIKGMQALIDANRIDEKSVGDEYIRLPNTPAYGPMRGLLVHRAIHNDLKGTLGIDTINETAPEKALGDFMSFFKQAMTTLNIPKGHTRALFQNVATMYFSGVGTHDVGLVAPSFNLGTWRWFIKSLGYMEQNHELWQLAQELGGRTGTFTTTELRHAYGLVRKLKIQERMNSGDKTAQVQAVFDFIEGAKGIAADMFNFWDTWARFTKFVHEIENNKSAPGDAIIEANEWAPDYSLVPQWVREARNYYIPFLTFFYKLTPKFADQISRVAGHVQRGEVFKAADIALRFASPMMLWTGVTSAAAASMLGMDDDEHRSLRAAMSKYFRENPGVIPMPFRDAEGRIVLIDIGIMFPWTQSVRAAEYLTQGRILEAAGQIGFGHPVVAVGAAWQTGVDPYTGMPLFPETATEAEKNIAYLAFLFNYLTPPPLRGLIDPLVGALTGQRVQLGGGEFARGIDYYFGDGMTASGKPIEDPPYLAARFLTGFNFNAFEPIDQSNRNARQLAYEIEQVETDRRRAMRDYGNRLRRIRNRPGISAERRESMMAERRRQHLAYLERLDDRRDRLRRKLTEYRADVRAIRAFEREREE